MNGRSEGVMSVRVGENVCKNARKTKARNKCKTTTTVKRTDSK